MLRVLIVEDNPADAKILQMALERTGAPLDMVVREDGVKAMEYLTAGNTVPCDLVLLDLNLPRLNGFEVLDGIRSRPELKSLPVVVMSGSADTRDVDRCYGAGASSYICKRTHLVDILAVAAQIVAYWSQCVKLPSGPSRREFGRWDDLTPNLRRSIWIVLAEDNPPDAFLIREALNREGLLYRLDALEDGDEMLRFIDRLDADAQAAGPDLFMIDLNLPRRSGGEVLSYLQASERCAGIPVIVISSSETPPDSDRLKTLGTKYYFRKPSDLKEFLKIGGYIRSVLEQHDQA